MAVGQLLDHRRSLANRAATDLAVLVPERPDQEVIEYLHDVGMKVMWFTKGFGQLRGDVRLGST